MNQPVLPEILLPVYPETSWELCLLDAMIMVQRAWEPSRCLSSGCPLFCGGTEDRFFRDSCILTKKGDPFSCDHSAVFEVFVLAWKMWMGEFYETDLDLSLSQMDEIYRRCFFIDSIDILPEEFPKGIVSGLLKLPEWLSWLLPFGFSVEVVEDPTELRFGDFCRIQDGEDPKEGTTVVVLGEGWENDRPVIYAWSSYRCYDKKWSYGYARKQGHGCSFFFLRKRKKGWKRIFHAARIKDASHAAFNDVRQMISQ